MGYFKPRSTKQYLENFSMLTAKLIHTTHTNDALLTTHKADCELPFTLLQTSNMWIKQSFELEKSSHSCEYTTMWFPQQQLYFMCVYSSGWKYLSSNGLPGKYTTLLAVFSCMMSHKTTEVKCQPYNSSVLSHLGNC